MAYSVTPPQTILASSPLSRPVPCYRRVSRGGQASTSAQRSSITGLLNPLDYADRTDELRKYSLSSSISRRSVSSSPTVSSESFQKSSDGIRVSAAAVTNITVGFETSSNVGVLSTSLPAPFTSDGTPVSFTFAPKVAPPKPGLLSKALSSEVAFSQQDLGLSDLPIFTSFVTSPGSGQAPAFFPDVDLRPLRRAQERHDIFNNELVQTAYMVAAKAHQNQLRKNGESVLSHCLEVAQILAGLGLDEDTVAAGLLHEVLDSSEHAQSQVEEFMPSRVVELVDRVNNISEISRLYRKHKDDFGDEKFRRLLVAMEDVKAVLVKIADRIHNMRTASVLPRDKQVALAQETLEVYSVVANRLGVWNLKAQLEDLAFAVLQPAEYAWVKALVKDRQDPKALAATIDRIRAGLEAQGVQYEDISGRPKNLYGIWLKLQKEGGGTRSLDEVYDVTALRVIVANKHDCYRALRALQSVYRCMPNRSKDYIKDLKKPNGYQSLHETVWGEGCRPMEVQIRTHKMHYIAEYGFAAHWKYKEKLDSEDEWLEKETQYKRWLTHYKLGVHDKKVRPQGCPQTDSSLKSLGVAFLDGSEGVVDPFLRHDRFKLKAPTKSEVNVVLATQDTLETRSLPLGSTAHQLYDQLRVASLPGYTLTVNGRLPTGKAALKSGDLVQVVPVGAVGARSPPDSGRLSQHSNTLEIHSLGKPPRTVRTVGGGLGVAAAAAAAAGLNN